MIMRARRTVAMAAESRLAPVVWARRRVVSVCAPRSRHEYLTFNRKVLPSWSCQVTFDTIDQAQRAENLRRDFDNWHDGRRKEYQDKWEANGNNLSEYRVITGLQVFVG